MEGRRRGPRDAREPEDPPDAPPEHPNIADDYEIFEKQAPTLSLEPAANPEINNNIAPRSARTGGSSDAASATDGGEGFDHRREDQR